MNGPSDGKDHVFRIIVDTHSAENVLFDFISDITSEIDDSPSVERKHLDIGDVHIKYNEKTIVVERKTMQDFAASIRDSRYHEQKYRAKEGENPPDWFIYAIEHPTTLSWCPNSRVAGVTHRGIQCAIAKTQIRDGIPTFTTSTTEGTAQLIVYIARELQKNNFVVSKGAGYAGVVKKRKKDNVVGETAQIVMLSSLPGVSHESALSILREIPFSSIANDTPVSKLASVKHKGRRLGEARATRVIDALRWKRPSAQPGTQLDAQLDALPDAQSSYDAQPDALPDTNAVPDLSILGSQCVGRVEGKFDVAF